MPNRILLALLLATGFASAQPGPGGFPGPGIRPSPPTAPTSGIPNVPMLPSGGTSVLRPEALRYPGTAGTPGGAAIPVILPPAPSRQPPIDPWDEARMFYASASARVAEARRAVEEHNKRLQDMGINPDTDLVSNIAAAEAALKSAQEAFDARDLDAARDAIRRANILSRSVLNILARPAAR